MKRLYLFVGPSLFGADLAQLCAPIEADVRILPPVQQGDLLRLNVDSSCVVAIIDGVFFQLPSVTHKEILLTLERGVRVLGASSLGALRAAELDVFGMEGVGAIYRQYKRGTIDGDDEVAVLHAQADEGYRPLSEPLVSIRHNVRLARAGGVISTTTATAIVRLAKRMHFAQRTYPGVLHAVRGLAPAAELDNLQGFVRDQGVDLKRADALALIDLLADRFAGRRAWPAVAQIKANRTVYAHLFLREYAGRSADGRHVSDAFVLSLYKLLGTSAPRAQRRAMRLALGVEEARHLGLTAPDPWVLLSRFRAESDLGSDTTLHRWLDGHCLSIEELCVALAERELERQLPRGFVADVEARTGMSRRFLQRTPRMAPGIPWDGPLLRETKLSGAFHSTLEHARQILEFVDQLAVQMPGLADSLASSRLEAWAADKWAVRESALRRQLLSRGFSSYREFIDVARLAYVYEWLATPRQSRAAVAPSSGDTPDWPAAPARPGRPSGA